MVEYSMQDIFSKAYLPLYISILVVCFIIALQVYNRLQFNIGRASEIKAFKRIIIAYIIYIFDDLLWLSFYPHSQFVAITSIFEYIETGILTTFTFCWFLFAEYYIDGFLIKNKFTKYLFTFPLILALITSTYFCLNVVGLVGSTTISSTYLYSINSSIDFFYMGFAFIHTLISLQREKRKTKKMRYLVILECILYPAAGAIISLFIFYVPFIILGILPSIIKVLIEMQNANIYTDALTRINNRYRVNEYLEKEWPNISLENPIVIYIIDVNRFKGINDKYGHLEGDRALIAVADSLKKAASQGIVIGRFGGDEFILVDSQNHDPEEIIKELRDNLQIITQKEQFPFDLTISIGYADCCNPDVPIANVIEEADNQLYLDKKTYREAIRMGNHIN
ncbi:MAG: GGDEF domain-containing protein [Sharpea porci]|uniref:GGDEF domain-containing protein n=1 Tax=Sharpea porci TaxID=2652286 RepID=UPI0024096BE4|nr:GGDEF domain-containing protein [Sharpea porci]MDD6712490.1 GGDEF domain-containing protein [Sharpea porci]